MDYMSAPNTSVRMRVKGKDYVVESYYVGKKNVYDTIIRLAEKEAYEEMREARKIRRA